MPDLRYYTMIVKACQKHGGAAFPAIGVQSKQELGLRSLQHGCHSSVHQCRGMTL